MPVKLFRKLFLFATLSVFIITFFYPISILAAESCTATVSPSSIQTNQVEVVFTFSITNTGSPNAISYIRIEVPSSNFTLVNYGVAGWSVNASNTQAELTGGSIAAGDSANITFRVTTGSSQAASANWKIYTNAGGPDDIACTGTLGTAIVGETDVTPPVLSAIGVSNVTTTSVTISWTTDEASSTVLDYYNDGGDSGTVNGTGGVTSHSVDITGLKAGTTYYYSPCSTDSNGNQGCGAEGTFTTSTVAATATPTTASGVTVVTATPTLTPTPTPVPIDRTVPKVTITSTIEKSYKEAPLIEGKATDNKEVSSVSYSTDGGNNWLPVETSDGLGTDTATFSFTPYIFDDGNYDIIVRAIDSNSNEGRSDTFTLVLDRLPPQVGGNLISLGPQILLPNEDGVIVTIAGLELKITLSAVGGPTNIDLLINDEKFSLTHSNETGLWSGYITLNSVGLYRLKTEATDGAGNKTERDLNPILAVEPAIVTNSSNGNKLKGGQVTLYIRDSESSVWNVWDGATFGQENPQKITDTGNYQYFLPPGTYYLEIKSSGFQTQLSKIFHLSETTPFNADFELAESNSSNFFGLLPFFSFSKKLDVTLKKPKYNASDISDGLIESNSFNFKLPSTSGKQFDITDLRGNNAVLSFVSTWSPPSVEQVRVLSEIANDKSIPIAVISTQETLSKVSIFAKKGGYNTDFVVDADGTLVSEFNLNSLPTHFFLERNGKIKKIVTGVLNKDELQAIYDGI